MNFKIKFKEAVFVRDEFLDFQEKTVEPSRVEQEVVADTGFDGLKKVTVKEIPSNLQDVSATTAQKDTVLQGKEFISADGLLVEGSMPNNGAVIETIDTQKASYTIPKGYHNGEGTVSLFVESKTIEPTKTTQIVNPSQGKVLSEVNISPIPEEYIIPKGSVSITENGSYNVRDYKDAVVNVPIPEGTKTITENGTYDVTEFAEAVVEVPKIDLTQATATEADVKEGKTFYAGDDTLKVGTLSAENKLAKVVDKSVTEITASDLEGVTFIGSYVFSSCKSLTSVVIPDSVTTIGNSAFSSCSSLTEIAIPASVTGLGTSSFSGCSNLHTVYYQGSLAGWVNMAKQEYSSSACGLPPSYDLYINGEAVTDLIFPPTIDTLLDSAFRNCRSLKSVTIPASVTTVKDDVFCDCVNLESVNVYTVGAHSAYLFKGCKNLTSVTLCEGIKILGANMFQNCTALTKIIIPETVTLFNYYTFDGCNDLEVTMLSKTPPELKTNTFSSVSSFKGKIIVPIGCGEAYKSATNWSNYARKIVEATE